MHSAPRPRALYLEVLVCPRVSPEMNWSSRRAIRWRIACCAFCNAPSACAGGGGCQRVLLPGVGASQQQLRSAVLREFNAAVGAPNGG